MEPTAVRVFHRTTLSSLFFVLTSSAIVSIWIIEKSHDLFKITPEDFRFSMQNGNSKINESNFKPIFMIYTPNKQQQRNSSEDFPVVFF